MKMARIKKKALLHRKPVSNQFNKFGLKFLYASVISDLQVTVYGLRGKQR